MAEVSLYDSAICRLCAENNENGELLYAVDGDEMDLSSMVNRYLPMKIHDDGKLPRLICPGCNIQLEATIQFLELLVEGQRKIRDMWKDQLEVERKNERERLRAERGKNKEESMERLQSINFEENDKNDDEFERGIMIKILPDGSMYAAEHEMSLQMEGLSKPRRKRGRPPKSVVLPEGKDPAEENADGASQEEEEEDEEKEKLEDYPDEDGRRRRKRKVPKRFSEAVQGKELERIFKEEGVIDDDDETPDAKLFDDTDERVKLPDGHQEIIGHLESEEGKDLGELVIVNHSRGRGRAKIRRRKNKFTCKLCGRGFLQPSRYIMHKSFHKGVKYQCSECKKQFVNRENCALHQKTTGHTGEGVLDDGIEMEEFHLEEAPESTDPDKDVEKLDECPSTPDKLDSTKLPVSNEDLSSETSISPEKVQTSSKNDEEAEKTEQVEETSEKLLNITNSPNEKSNDETKLKKGLDPKIQSEAAGKIDGKSSYTCTLCNKAFVHKTSLKEHLSTHEHNKSNRGYPCDVCGKVLNHPSSVIYHKEAEHNGRRFVCNKCGKSFKHKQLLQRHQLVHSDDRPYLCGSCNATFKTKANLINHQFTHTGEKKYSCELCGQQFAHKTSLTLHYRWHTGHKPYSCQVCNKSFSQNGNLQEHMRIHTGEKPYCCDHCGRKFTTSSQFKLHVKRHTGERPWKCEYCAKTFLHKDTWKCHVRRHKGERPFQCAECNRGFTEQWALKKHLRLHTGEKPYSCEICGKAFADCSNLTKHRRVHRENKTVALNDISKVSNDGELWQILPSTGNDSDEMMGEHMSQVIAGEETSEDGMPQIIYVSYQDPDDPNQSRTLHFVDVGVVDEKESISDNVINRQSLASLNVPDPVGIISKQNGEDVQQDSARQIEMELAEQNLQLQITDEEGNPIPLSIQDARQLLADGRFVSQLADGQAIRVSDELAQQLNVQVEPNQEIEEPVRASSSSSASIGSTNQNDADSIVKVLEDEDTDATVVAAVNQMAGEPEIDDGAQTIEFTTQDGQKVRLVTSYNVDPMQLASEYLTIV